MSSGARLQRRLKLIASVVRSCRPGQQNAQQIMPRQTVRTDRPGARAPAGQHRRACGIHTDWPEGCGRDHRRDARPAFAPAWQPPRSRAARRPVVWPRTPGFRRVGRNQVGCGRIERPHSQDEENQSAEPAERCREEIETERGENTKGNASGHSVRRLDEAVVREKEGTIDREQSDGKGRAQKKRPGNRRLSQEGQNCRHARREKLPSWAAAPRACRRPCSRRTKAGGCRERSRHRNSRRPTAWSKNRPTHYTKR